MKRSVTFNFGRGVIITILFALAAITGYNIKNNSKFLEMSLFNVITIIIALLVSFYLTQRYSDRRKKKEIFQDILRDIQKCVSSESAYTITKNTDRGTILMHKRGLNSKLCTAKKVANEFGVEKDIEFLIGEFNEYDQIISDHLHDLEFLEKSSKELQRPLDIIYNRINEILLAIY